MSIVATHATHCLRACRLTTDRIPLTFRQHSRSFCVCSGLAGASLTKRQHNSGDRERLVLVGFEGTRGDFE